MNRRRVASPSARLPVRASGDTRRPEPQPCVALEDVDPEEDACLMEGAVDGEDGQEVESEEAEEYEEEEDATTTKRTMRCVPKRPQRKAANAARVQRFVLAGPGQVHVPAAGEGTKRAEAFMTHLPDSPPRIYNASGSKSSRDSIFTFSGHSRVQRMAAEEKKEIEAPSQTSSGREEEHKNDEEQEEDQQVLPSAGTEDDEESEDSTEQRPEVDESSEEVDVLVPTEELSSPGPHVVDIAVEPTTTDSLELEETEGDDDLSDSDNDSDNDSDSDSDSDHDREEEEYKAMQQGRARFEAEQLERDSLRRELESYVASLTAMCDDQGEPLIEFPKNFQQIVSLMTVRDIERDDDRKSSNGKTAANNSDKQKSWSQVLIQNSLAKQQAYGSLDESEEGGDGESSMAAKIALKMARIRQLDVILEAKLGKNLYSTTAPVTKKVKKVNPQEPEVSSRSKSSLTTTRGSMDAVSSGPSGMDFVERNRRVVENGAKANMTRAEEQRLKKLMRNGKQQPQTQSDEILPTTVAEFKLDQLQQEEIEKLIAEKRGVYQSAVTMALDDGPEEEFDVASDASLKRDQRKPNIVQEAKRERLRKQRLQRIEEELQFLHANTSVAILPDEDDDDASDGCMSERSYMTTTSVLSTCSTRSGVTRRQLDQFVATEMNKAECSSGSKASRDDIQNLLRSLSHVSINTSRPATTTSV